MLEYLILIFALIDFYKTSCSQLIKAMVIHLHEVDLVSILMVKVNFKTFKCISKLSLKNIKLEYLINIKLIVLIKSIDSFFCSSKIM